MHSDCIFKKEQAMCLEKIQRVNDLMGLNDSSPGEDGGGGAPPPEHRRSALELMSPPLATYRKWWKVQVLGSCRKPFGTMEPWICSGQ